MLMTLEVIGPGFGRTGTNSMKLALEQLGFGPCHHMFEVRDNPDRLKDWEKAARGDKVDWSHTFRGYRSQVDWPGARYWRELVDHFPKAKVILTVRDPDAWFDSVQKTIVPFIAARGSHPSDSVNAIAKMGHKIVFVDVFDDRLSDRAYATKVFNDHIAQVKKAVPKERLLVIDVEEGWAPLCKFLGVEIPDTPFPKTNSTREFHGTEWKQ
jgi:hypothetical protein